MRERERVQGEKNCSENRVEFPLSSVQLDLHLSCTENNTERVSRGRSVQRRQSLSWWWWQGRVKLKQNLREKQKRKTWDFYVTWSELSWFWSSSWLSLSFFVLKSTLVFVRQDGQYVMFSNPNSCSFLYVFSFLPSWTSNYYETPSLIASLICLSDWHFHYYRHAFGHRYSLCSFGYNTRCAIHSLIAFSPWRPRLRAFIRTMHGYHEARHKEVRRTIGQNLWIQSQHQRSSMINTQHSPNTTSSSMEEQQGYTKQHDYNYTDNEHN